MNGKLTRAVATFSRELRFDALPPAVCAQLKRLVADNLACSVGGRQTPLARSVIAYTRNHGGKALCPVPGTDVLTGPAAATFAWATLANAQDYDDTGSRGHPGSSLVPAVLSLARCLGRSGRDVVTALAVGYEVNDRVARGTLPSLARYSAIHANGSLQAPGVAAACARLADLDFEQTLDCLGLACAMAPVPHASKFGWEDKSICSIKDNVALPAENGVRAALLVREGYEGSGSILDGAGGFAAMLGSDRCDEAILSDFGEYRVLRTALKPYPCCRWIHTALDALADLVRQHALIPANLEQLVVTTTPSVADKFGRTVARTFLDVQFSTPLCLALLLHSTPREAWFEQHYWNDPAVLATAARIQLRGDDAQLRRFVELERQSSRVPVVLEAHVRHGQVLHACCDLAMGAPEKPLSAAACEAKWLALLEPGLGNERSRSLLGMVDRLEHLDQVDALLEMSQVL